MSLKLFSLIKSKFSSLKLKKRYAIFCIVILIIGLLIVGYFIYSNYSKSEADKKASQNGTSIVKKVSDTVKSANTKAQKGNTSGALSDYDKEIASATDKKTKSSLLMSKSSFALSNNKKDIALQSALEAVKVDKRGATLSRLAWVYSQAGDKANAIKYYTEAADAVDSELGTTNSNSSQSYRKRAAELSKE